MKIFTIAATALMLTVAPVTLAYAAEMPTADQCNSWFAKYDTNADGSLGKGENKEVVELMNKNSTTTMNEDEIIAKDAFLVACGKGTLGMPKS